MLDGRDVTSALLTTYSALLYLLRILPRAVKMAGSAAWFLRFSRATGRRSPSRVHARCALLPEVCGARTVKAGGAGGGGGRAEPGIRSGGGEGRERLTGEGGGRKGERKGCAASAGHVVMASRRRVLPGPRPGLWWPWSPLAWRTCARGLCRCARGNDVPAWLAGADCGPGRQAGQLIKECWAPACAQRPRIAQVHAERGAGPGRTRRAALRLSYGMHGRGRGLAV